MKSSLTTILGVCSLAVASESIAQFNNTDATRLVDHQRDSLVTSTMIATNSKGDESTVVNAKNAAVNSTLNKQTGTGKNTDKGSANEPEKTNAPADEKYNSAENKLDSSNQDILKPNNTNSTTSNLGVLDFTHKKSARNLPVETGSGVFNASPIAVIVSLFLIVLLIFLIFWMLRRIGAVPFSSGQSMKIVAGLSVGTREKVVLIEVGSKQFLIGVASGRVSHLHCFDEPVVSTPVVSTSDFSQKLKQLLQQNVLKESTHDKHNKRA